MKTMRSRWFEDVMLKVCKLSHKPGLRCAAKSYSHISYRVLVQGLGLPAFREGMAPALLSPSVRW